MNVNVGRLATTGAYLFLMVGAVLWAVPMPNLGPSLSAIFSVVGIFIIAGMFIIGIGAYMQDRKVIAGGAGLLVLSALCTIPLSSITVSTNILSGKFWVTIVLAFVGLSLFGLGLWRAAVQATLTGAALLLLAALIQLDYTLVIPALIQFFSGSTWFTPSVALLISGAVLVLAGQFLLHSRNLMLVGVLLIVGGLMAKTSWSLPFGNIGIRTAASAIYEWMLRDYNFAITIVGGVIAYGFLSHVLHGKGGGARLMATIFILLLIFVLFMGYDRSQVVRDNLADGTVNLTEKVKTWDFNAGESTERVDAPPVQEDVITDIESVPAGSSGETIAPRGKWSEWREFSQTGLCLRVWTANRKADDIFIRYIDRDGETWSYDGNYMPNVLAISFRSKIGRPIQVNYEAWKKIPGKKCILQ